jgi:hypothetical protein
MAIRTGVLVAIFTLFCFSPVLGQVPLYFVPEYAEISGEACGWSEYCVEVHVGEVEMLAGYDIQITFQPEHLNFLEAREGDFFSGAGHPSSFFHRLVLAEGEATEDTVFVNCADLGDAVSGAGHLFSVCFVPPWSDMATALPLCIIGCELRDIDNGSIPCDPSDGTISVLCPTATEVTVWGVIKSLYR